MSRLGSGFLAACLLVAPAILAAELEFDESTEQRSPLTLLSSEALVARGERLLDQADRASVNLAADYFKHALAQDPNHGPAAAGLARVAFVRYTRRWVEDDALVDQAIESGRAAVALAPDDARSHAALALAGMAAGDSDVAHEEADRAWALRGPATPAWVAETYAQSLIARREFDAARRVLVEALSASPERFQSHHVLGNLYLEQAMIDDAVLSYRRALALEEEYTPSRMQIAEAYERAGNRSLAGKLYAETMRKFPEEVPRVHLRAAASLIGLGRYEDALEALGKAQLKTRRGLGEGTVLYLKGRCLEGLARRSEAEALYRRVIEEFPLASYGALGGDALATSAFEGLARLAFAGGKPDEAVRLMEEAMSRSRPTLSLILGLARVYGDYGLHAEAASLLRRGAGTDFGPRNAGAKASIYVAWARALRAQGYGAGAGAAEPAGNRRRAAREPADGDAPSAGNEILAALERDRESLQARGGVADLLEAARACAILGDRAHAIEWLGHAVDRGYRHLDWIDGDQEMSALTGEPSFATLKKRVPGS